MDPMNTLTSDSLPAAAVLSEILSRMWQDDGITYCQPLARMYFGTDADVFGVYLNPIGDIPQFAYFYNGNRYLWLWNGVDGFLAANVFFNGFRDTTDQNTVRGVNGATWRAVEQMRRLLASAAANPAGAHHTFCGHSYGGTVALLAAAAMRILDGTSRQKVITFGSPRCVTDRFASDRAYTSDMTRFMLQLDPVPYVVPTRAEVPWTYGPMRTPFGGGYDSPWRQFGNGIVLGTNGRASEAMLPDLAGLSVRTGIVGWATTVMQPTFRAHSIHNYADWLFRWLPGQQVPAPPAEVPQGVVVVPPVEPAPAVIQPLVKVPPAPTVVVENTPTPTTAPSEKAFYAAKYNGQWFVWHWDTPIVNVRSGRLARRLAAKYNSVVVQWNNSTYADKPAFADAFNFELGE